MNKAGNNLKFNRLILSFVICSFVICHFTFAEAKVYDGIWFMGFNLKHPVFKDQRVREAVQRTIDIEEIVNNIVSEETYPIGFVPPGMLGYDPDLKPYVENTILAKMLMKKAGFPVNDKRLKNISLLHTDGVLTVSIAQKIRDDLKAIGINASLTEVSISEEDEWVRELASGKHALFLMGYKAGIEQLFSTEEASGEIDSASLLQPLFSSNGEANFTGYSNSKVDLLFSKLEGLDLALKSERHPRLKEINAILHKDLPVVVLFYIEKL